VGGEGRGAVRPYGPTGRAWDSGLKPWVVAQFGAPVPEEPGPQGQTEPLRCHGEGRGVLRDAASGHRPVLAIGRRAGLAVLPPLQAVAESTWGSHDPVPGHAVARTALTARSPSRPRGRPGSQHGPKRDVEGAGSLVGLGLKRRTLPALGSPGWTRELDWGGAGTPHATPCPTARPEAGADGPPFS
jgi:hypothetical protein